MIVFYFNKEQTHHTRMIQHLHNSFPGEKRLYPTAMFQRNARINQVATIIVFAGMIRGEGMIYQWCKANDKRFLYIDHAYLNRGYDRTNPNSEWMRITDSDFSWNKMEYRPQDRWLQYFADLYPRLNPWHRNRNKPNILLLPPSSATKYLFPDSENWTEQMTRLIKRNSNKEIIIREKPLQPQINNLNQLIGLEKFIHEKTIEQELDDASLVVTYNSAVAVQATILGIPSISHPTGVGHKMSVKWDEIDNPPEPPRQYWLNQLVYHQYRTQEMIDGTIWKMLLTNAELAQSSTIVRVEGPNRKNRKSYIAVDMNGKRLK